MPLEKWKLLIGSAAAISTTIAFLPQMIKIRRTGGRDVSYPMLFLFLFGVLLWLAYGLMLRDAAIVIANAVTACMVAPCILFKWSLARSGRPLAPPARAHRPSP